ncbi:MAG: NAD-dependent epimerase/dehydratase family protein [Bacteroidetes bacterium]|nr:NAD-dependent epimerase/dehydratase family protein [Bacteroidota bacterium]
MKIAVTGSEGFIGRLLTKRLDALGHETIRVDLLHGDDILDLGKLTLLPEFDLAIHLASRLMVPESYSIPHAYYTTNVLGTLNILELCRLRGAKMIFFSSYLYGTPEYQPIDELHPLSPFNPYAQSKILGEELCNAYNRDFGVPVTIFRPFNIYGPGQHPHFLIPNIISQCLTGQVMLKDPRPRRDFIYVDDVVDACIAALSYSGPGVDIFNLGYGKSSSIPDIIHSLQIILDKEIDVHFSHETRENEVLDTICDIRKASALLGWNPKTNLEEGLRKIIASAKNQ